METIQFRVIKLDNQMCRIKAVDCRSIYRNIADSGCVCSLSVMLSEMEHIAEEVRKLGDEAVFVI